MQALLAVCPGSICQFFPTQRALILWGQQRGQLKILHSFPVSFTVGVQYKQMQTSGGGTSRNTAEKLVSTLGEVWTPVLSAHLQSLWTCCLSGSAVFLTCAMVSAY